MKAVVISNKSQFDKLRELGWEAQEYQVYCDNIRLHAWLRENGISFISLGEELLRDKWDAINAWGCQSMLEWGRRSRQKEYFRELDLPAVLNLFLSYILIPAVKNYHFAQIILEKPGLSGVLIFKTENRRKYPYFSGNVHLNHFLELLGRRRGVPVEEISVYEKENEGYVVPLERAGWSAQVKAWLKGWVNGVYGGFVQPNGRIRVFVKGSIKHLGSCVQALKRRKADVAIYDFEFHREQWAFARAENIPYYIPSCFRAKKGADRKGFADGLVTALRVSLEEAIRERLFVYEGENLGDFVREHVFYGVEDYLWGLMPEAEIFENILASCDVKAWLVDEDYALRGAFLAAFMKARRVAFYCVSHANMAVSFSVPPESRCFSNSTTLVQSMFEKEMYASRGWDPGRIVVTGAPRYDRLLELKKSLRRRPARQRGDKIKLLYAATGLWLYSPDQHGYLGSHSVCFGDYQIPAFRMILEAAKDLPIEMVVKPHSAEAVSSWRRFVRSAAPAITVTEASEDFFKLLVESDAMILSYWSTGLIEAGLAGIPSIFVAPQIDSAVLSEFSKNGYCRLVKTKEELRAELKHLCEGGPERCLSASARVRSDYYLGNNDGKSAGRVVDLILSGGVAGAVEKPAEKQRVLFHV